MGYVQNFNKLLLKLFKSGCDHGVGHGVNIVCDLGEGIGIVPYLGQLRCQHIL